MDTSLIADRERLFERLRPQLRGARRAIALGPSPAARRTSGATSTWWYPNGLPGGVPAEVFTVGQAADAVGRAAAAFVAEARRAVRPG